MIGAAGCPQVRVTGEQLVTMIALIPRTQRLVSDGVGMFLNISYYLYFQLINDLFFTIYIISVTDH